MQRVLEMLVKELKPWHDFDRVGYTPSIFAQPDGRSFKDMLGDGLHFAYFALNSVKHVLRGGVAGAAAGYLASQAFGFEVEMSVKEGMAWGVFSDLSQYMLREHKNTAIDVIGGVVKSYVYVRNRVMRARE